MAQLVERRPHKAGLLRVRVPPSAPKYSPVAQPVEAGVLQALGRRFEPCRGYQSMLAWRNGRRGRLRTSWGNSRGGSSPSASTNSERQFSCSRYDGYQQKPHPSVGLVATRVPIKLCSRFDSGHSDFKAHNSIGQSPRLIIGLFSVRIRVGLLSNCSGL